MSFDGTIDIGNVITAIIFLVSIGGFLARVHGTLAELARAIRDLGEKFHEFCEESSRDRQNIRERLAKLEGAIEWPLIKQKEHRDREA